MLSREWMEPGMFGVWRPVLIWPEGLSERLEDAHIEAILAHELMHAWRRDNLTSAVHMLVEAAFWFHPLVWWMERRMVEERERACDEAVVEMGSRPGVYAESLLKAVRFCVESPLVCVAGITGADLSRRVRSIMTLRLERLGWWRKAALAALALAAVLAPVGFGVLRMIPMYGQVLKATGPLPSYEVVVIKPSKDGAHGASTTGEQTQYLVTAKMLIQFAYGIYSPPKVIDLNVVGGPDWINTDVFDIVGKMESTEFQQEQNLGRAQRHERRQLMEQSLLADRFKLKMHTEMRDEPVYALTVIKGGPKMAPAKDVTGGAHVNPYPSSSNAEELKRGLIVRRVGQGFEMTVKGMTLDTFVDALMAQKETAARQVVNQTGLTGAYDFTLKWGPENTTASDSGDVEEPGLFTAIQQQLGLKLADGKGPGEVVVIDRIEKPVFDSAAVPDASLKPVAMVKEKPVAESSRAQSPPQNTAVPLARYEYEAATIKPSQGPGPYKKIGLWAAPDGFSAWFISPQQIISIAYGVESFQLSGGPSWLPSERFDVEVKMDSATADALGKLNPEQRAHAQQQMLQALVAERFQLKVHRETKEGTIYTLVIAKGGSKLREAKPGVPGMGDMGSKFSGDLTAQTVPIAQLAKILTQMLGHPVLDKTELKGVYDFELRFTPDDRLQPPPGAPPDSRLPPPPADSNAPSLFDALQEQLGLKLESGKGPVDVIVIDHVERPSGN